MKLDKAIQTYLRIGEEKNIPKEALIQSVKAVRRRHNPFDFEVDVQYLSVKKRCTLIFQFEYTLTLPGYKGFNQLISSTKFETLEQPQTIPFQLAMQEYPTFSSYNTGTFVIKLGDGGFSLYCSDKPVARSFGDPGWKKTRKFMSDLESAIGSGNVQESDFETFFDKCIDYWYSSS